MENAALCIGAPFSLIVEGREINRRNMQREFPTAPLVGVGAVIVNQGRVLLVKRGTEPSKGIWSIPGGLIELGELLSDAVTREVQEETGMLVEPIELIELIDRVHRERDRVRYHYVIADYLCRLVGGTLLAASDAAGVRWIERDQWLSSAVPQGAQDTSSDVVQLDPLTARIIEAGWQRAISIEAKGMEGQ
jgi:8-oxo-dGTP diphosphatase